MNAPAETVETPPRWRLDDLYSGLADPAIEADLASAEALADELAGLEGAFLAPAPIRQGSAP